MIDSPCTASGSQGLNTFVKDYSRGRFGTQRLKTTLPLDHWIHNLENAIAKIILIVRTIIIICRQKIVTAVRVQQSQKDRDTLRITIFSKEVELQDSVVVVKDCTEENTLICDHGIKRK